MLYGLWQQFAFICALILLFPGGVGFRFEEFFLCLTVLVLTSGHSTGHSVNMDMDVNLNNSSGWNMWRTQ